MNQTQLNQEQLLEEKFNVELQLCLTTFLDSQISNYAYLGNDFSYQCDLLRKFIINGGKRVRPYFIFLGWIGYSDLSTFNDIPPALLKIAASFEIMHAAALIHDDLIDKSELRRGNPTLQIQFANYLAEKHDLTDSHFGKSSALLTGDLALTWADDLFYTIGETPDKNKLNKLWQETRTTVLAGQYYDILSAASLNDSMDRAQQINELKTATYTIELPLLLGATLGGTNPTELTKIRAYGKELGNLFQLNDDLIGAFGDENSSGKPAGDDFINHKKTILILESINELKKDDSMESTKIATLINSNSLNTDDVEKIKKYFIQHGIIDSYKLKLEKLHQESSMKLNKLKINNFARNKIYVFSKKLTQVTV